MRRGGRQTCRRQTPSLACATSSGAGTATGSSDPRAGEAEFRALFKELIEINTTLSVGSCTKASEAMKTRLLAAGYPESDLHILVNPKPNRPQDGNLVATENARP